jgi:CheY-like chemotaxis protein
MTQVAANLLNNAARYTDPEGTISLTSLVDGNEAVIRVGDNGYGIPSASMEKLFALFTQVSEHRAKTGGGGLGIGLALCRRLMEMHGGSITAASDGLGHGAEFEARLPLDRAARTSSRERPTGESRSRPCHILVVEDNPDAADSLASLLELVGHTVAVANDGESALRQVTKQQPDALLLDLGLPGIDGLEVARRIRAMPDGHRPVIIAMTGWGQEDDFARTRQAGFDDHLVKPIALHDINRILSTALPG